MPIPSLQPATVVLVALLSLVIHSAGCSGDEDGASTHEQSAGAGHDQVNGPHQPNDKEEPSPSNLEPPPLIEAEPQPLPQPQEPDESPAAPPKPEHLSIHHPDELQLYESLGFIRALELLNSPEHVGETNSEPCPPLQTARLLSEVQSLKRLHVARCSEQLRELLRNTNDGQVSNIAQSLETLELSELSLDRELIKLIAELPNLRQFVLNRVDRAPGVTDAIVFTISVPKLVLRDLKPDSSLGTALAGGSTLRALTLEGAWAGFRALQFIARATQLEEIRFVDTSISNYALSRLKPLINLKRVYWSGPKFNDKSPLYLRLLPIESFTCVCSNFGDAGLRHTRLLKGLTELNLPQSRITGTGLTHLTKLAQLEKVAIQYRDIDGQAFSALAQLQSLRELRIGEAELLSPRAKHLGKLVNLRVLELRLSNLDDRAAPQLAALENLVSLDLGNTKISDTGLLHLRSLKSLRSLKLHHTRVTKSGLADIGQLTQLESLELDHTDVVDAGVEHLSPLKKLKHLRLDYTLITDKSLATLAQLTNLETLNLANTVISDSANTALAKLPKLRSVNLQHTRAN